MAADVHLVPGIGDWSSPDLSVDPDHPLAKGLIWAGLPQYGGYIDATHFGNHTRSQRGANHQALQNEGQNGIGPHYQFSSGNSFNAGSSVLVPQAEFSFAAWVDLGPTLSSYGAIAGRVGTTGATAAGGDWQIVSVGGTKKLAIARSGALLATSSSVVSAGWYLWHFSLQASGDWDWWLSGPGANTISRGSGSGFTIRTATGNWLVNGQAADGSGGNSARTGRIYLWARATTQDDAATLYRSERELFAPRRIVVPGASAASTVPALSALTTTNITATTARLGLTLTF